MACDRVKRGVLVFFLSALSVTVCERGSEWVGPRVGMEERRQTDRQTDNKRWLLPVVIVAAVVVATYDGKRSR